MNSKRNDTRQGYSTIQRKFMRVVMLVSATVLILACSAFFVYEFVTGRNIAVQQVQTLAQVISSNSTAALAFDSKADAAETLAALKVEPHVTAAVLTDVHGKQFAAYPSATVDSFSIRTEQLYLFAHGNVEVVQPVVQEGLLLGYIYLRSDLKELRDRLMLYAFIAVLFIAVAFVFGYLLSKRLQRTISWPLMELAETARKISENRDYSIRAKKRTLDEVGDLTDSFNHMLTRIQQQNSEILGWNENLETKVKERTALIESIIDASVDIIVAFDKEFRFRIINKKGLEYYGLSREQLIGQQLTHLFPQTTNSGMLADLQTALSGEVVRNPNYRSTLANRHFEVFYIPLKDEKENVYLVLSVGHDVTEMLQANEKLRALNQELEKSNIELEQFAYVASHDLQEPLRKIRMFADLSESDMENTEKLKKYLTKINHSANRMAELIKSVLHYSRVTGSEQIFEQVNLNSCIENICSDLELLISEKNAVIRYDPLPVVKGIPLQLNQLFSNLINNSLKFNARTPEVNIRWQLVNGGGIIHGLQLDEGQYAEIELSDNGIGFRKEYAGSLFSIFKRLHSDKGYEGTGIGLALCKKITQNHKGYIAVESEENKGTSFFIYFPYFPESAN